MPDLKSDFVGRVNRLPLRPTDKSALTPIMEAVSNSIHAITERFDDKAGKQGRVDVTVVRDMEDEDDPIIGFDVEDNGVGFTHENYRSFLTPDSRHKEKRGGKGVGRLAWLKVFDEVEVDSVYFEGGAFHKRHFKFRLADKEQVKIIKNEKLSKPAEVKTRISFRGFDARFAVRCPSKQGTIALRVLSHFVPLFIGGNAPKVVITDQETIDIEALFADSIVQDKTTPIVVDIGGEQVALTLWSLKCNKTVRFDGGGYNFAFITANNRSVIDYSIDDQLGLKQLEGEYIYLGSASGEYLDQSVNAERTGFTLDNSEIDIIKRAIAKEAREFLKPYVEAALAEKVKVTHELITENPQFLYVEPTIKTFAEALQPNLFKKEDIFVELSRNRFRRQRTFASLERDIVKADVIDDALREKVEEYTKYVSDEKRGALAEYVTRRRAVIDLFERFLEFKDAEQQNYQKEEAIHRLICPMRVETSQLEIEDHNLWLLDDRLAFFRYFASDKDVASYANVESKDRPDLAFFYDSCVAWREGENSDTVVLVEFKKPMRDDFTSGRDPVQQILLYVKQLRTEKAIPDVKGRPIRGVNASTAFHCYVVADITPTLEERMIGRFHHTPDGVGYFGYSADPPAFVEIVPYGKILQDAKVRNTIFFKTLGITSEG
jgi:Histidine kinase-, DNA gyrase B-, and HSP90-like ATPase